MVRFERIYGDEASLSGAVLVSISRFNKPPLVAEAAPEVLAMEGVSTHTAASLLITATDNPERLKKEAYPDVHLYWGHGFQPLRARPSAIASTVT